MAANSIFYSAYTQAVRLSVTSSDQLRAHRLVPRVILLLNDQGLLQSFDFLTGKAF